jgi:DsbC/DsbD-like thiol-disulfide interchange protein
MVRAMKPQTAGAALTAGVALAVCLAGGVAPSHAATSQWARGSEAMVRLIAAGVGDDGRLEAGIEIALPPGWRTYWRSPGEAGIAPTIDLAGSGNIGPAEVLFPPPRRVDDGLTVTNEYEGRLILPLSAAVLDRSAAIDLSVSLDLGVCQEICIPDHVEARLEIPSGDSDSAAAKILGAARAALPGPPEEGVLFVDGISRDGGTDKRPVYRFTLTAAGASHADVFVEGPSDWYAGAPRLLADNGGSATYTVKFDRLVAKTPIAGARVRFTVVAGGRAIEQWLDLD